MQPIFPSFVSGVAYRKIVKLHFRSAMRFYLLVSIYENMLFQRFSSFLTAGNKSYCGTLQHLTHPQQSTDSPIPEPVSSSKRQASQRKPFALSSTPAQTSSRLRKHRTSVPSAPVDPMHTLPKVARNSATRKFNTAHKRCNPNGLVSMFERFTRELRATFFGNHAQRPTKAARNSSKTSFCDSSKTAEYQRSDFKT